MERWLVVLAILAVIAALQALVWPRWPRSPDLATARLGAGLADAGLNPRSLATLPAERSYERSLSAVLGWHLAGGLELRLARASVRERDNFQAAYIGRDRPQLTLTKRRLNVPMAGNVAGLIQGKQAYQTCLVPEIFTPNGMAVTAQALGKAADQRVAGRIETVKGLLGLQQTRSFDCILVSLRSQDKNPPPVVIWRQILASVSSSLQDSSRK
ncbi:MAG: hypothetical protein WCH37_07875 [Synechococcaceae cyanobacterium ELA182]